MSEIMLIEKLYDAIQKLRIQDVTRTIVDEELLRLLHEKNVEIDVFGLQALLSDWENSHVKIVWVNDFEATHGIRMYEWLSLGLANIVLNSRFLE